MGRANGEGSKPRKRKDGRWQANYTVHIDGKRKLKSVYGKTKAEVNRKLREALSARDRGMVFDSRGLTVSDFLRRWLEDSARPSVKVRTYEDYLYVVANHVEPEIGHVKLSDLTPAHIQALYARKLGSGLSNGTVLHIHRTLRRALNQAQRWRLIAENPVLFTDPPRKTRAKLEVLCPEQVEHFIRSCGECRLFPLYMTAALTGLRAGELLGLGWEDLGKDGGGHAILAVHRKLVYSKEEGLHIDEEGTKTGGGRTVRLSSATEAVLRIQRKRQLEERLAAGTKWTESGLIFTTRYGKPIHLTNLSQYLGRDLQHAGLPKIRFHDLRHSFATVLAGAGGDAVVVAGMLGHSDVSMTLNTYSHYLPTHQQWAIDRLDELFPASLLEESD